MMIERAIRIMGLFACKKMEFIVVAEMSMAVTGLIATAKQGIRCVCARRELVSNRNGPLQAVAQLNLLGCARVEKVREIVL